jgi:hypothetical protein
MTEGDLYDQLSPARLGPDHGACPDDRVTHTPHPGTVNERLLRDFVFSREKPAHRAYRVLPGRPLF